MSDYGEVQKLLGSVSKQDEIITVITLEGDLLLSDYSNYGIVETLKNYIKSQNKCKALPMSFDYKQTDYKIYCHEMEVQSIIEGENNNRALLLTLAPGWHISPPSYVFIYLLSISLLSVVILVTFLEFVMRKKILRPIERLTTEITKMAEMPLQKRYFRRGNHREANEIVLLIKSFDELLENLKKHQKQAETNAKLASIGSTSAILAHDVRKPFSKLEAMLDYFDDYKNSPKQLAQAKQEIKKSIKQVDSMINDIMDFSREVRLETKPESLVGMIDFSIREIVQVHQDVDISFLYDFQHTHKPLADNERMSRVFSNIIGNGIEAIRDIGKRNAGIITVHTHEIEKDGKQFIEIVISNDGPLIPEEDIPNLFESFFTKGKKKGTGLGLASAQKIVHLHEGEINARNRDLGFRGQDLERKENRGDYSLLTPNPQILNPKQGIEFVMTIPSSNEKEEIGLENVPKNSKEAAFVELKKDTAELEEIIATLKDQRFKILLLEDEALYRAAVKSTIRKNEILNKIVTIYDAHTVDEALEIIRSKEITHAVVDIDLGDVKDGFDFLASLTQNPKPKNENPKCMVHSNRHLDEFRQKAFSLGAKAFVPKPLALEHLVDFLAGDGKVSVGEESKNEFTVTSNQKPAPRILIINDDTMLLEGNTRVIEHYFTPCEIEKATNPEEAHAIMKNNEFDYIFCDIYYDNSTSNGYEFSREVRKKNPGVKLYLVSSVLKSMGEEEARKCGAHGFIEQLLNETKLERALEGSARQKESEPKLLSNNDQQSSSLLVSKIFHDIKKPYVKYSYMREKLPLTLQKDEEELSMNFEYATNLLELLQRYLSEKNIAIEEKHFIKDFEDEFRNFITKEKNRGGSHEKTDDECVSH